MAVVTYDIDHGFRGILKELKKLEAKPYVKVGYPSEEASDPHKGDKFVTILDLAIWHEFGTIILPERSFIRASFDNNRQKYEDLNKDLIKRIYGGSMTVEKALDILGVTLQTDIKTFINSGQVKPESLRALGIIKGKPGKTLYDTGQLVNAITWIRVMKS